MHTVRHYLTAAVLAAALICPDAVSADTLLKQRAESAEAARWADSVYNTLTERQRVAQLMCPKVVPTQGNKSLEVIRRLVRDNGVGALLFTEGSIKQYAEMINYAQSVAKVPVIITLDGEWGMSMRVRKTTRFPKNMYLGAIADSSLIRDYGAEVARQCRQLGIQVNFAPVADVNSNPANPVIGTRSFGEIPSRVATQVTQYSLGLENGLVQAVAKHFPGHGDTDGDSHKLLPSVKRNLGSFRNMEFVPFDKFIKNGCSGVMVGHISVPAIDKSGIATSLSPKTYRLLRDELDFDGLIYTDAMGMKGAATPDGSNNCVAALKAGADIIECHHAIEDINAVMKALKDGHISKTDIEKHCKLVLRYKYAMGLNNPTPVVYDGLEQRLNTPEAEALNRRLNAAMITCVRNNDNFLPMGNLESTDIAVVNLGSGADNAFADYCRRYGRVTVYAAPTSVIAQSTLEKIKKHNRIIVAVYNDKAATRTAYRQLMTNPESTAAVFFITPYKAAAFIRDKTLPRGIIMAYEDLPLPGEYAAQAVFGGIDVTGTLPVHMGHYDAGTGITLRKSRLGYTTPLMEGMKASLTDSIDSIASHLIGINGMPGCQVLVARNGNIVHSKAYGKLTKNGSPVTLSTVYDLASVSKALGTLPGVMKAVDLGLVKIDSAASVYIPQLRGSDKADITVREFLFHETGMPASLNMFNIMIDSASYSGKLITPKYDAMHPVKIQKGAYGHRDGRLRTDITSTVKTVGNTVEAARGIWVGEAAMDTIMNRIYTIPLRKDRSYNYSCLNFCTLMHVEQNATGTAHDKWLSDSITAPLGAVSVGYRPTTRLPISQIAPTENDTYLRRQTVHGYVHDETAAFSGGVQGNAGLFGNAEDLAKICQMWLNGGTYGDKRILSSETVDMFTTVKSPTCRRGLGFDKPDMENPDWSPTCEEAPADTYGHLGFTGTVFWVVPSQNLIFIFLTNRVNPTRDTPVFNYSGIRPELFRQTLNSINK